MRDALSLLDQVRSACGDAPDDAAVAEALGAVDAATIARMASGLVRRDGAAILAEVEALYGRGQEMKRVAEELVRHLRNVVVAKLVPQAPLDLPDAEVAEVRAQAQAATAPQLTRLLDLAQAAVAEVKEAEQPRFALEVALLEACFLAPGEDVVDLVQRLEAIAGGAAPRAPARDSSPIRPERSAAAGGAESRGELARPAPQPRAPASSTDSGWTPVDAPAPPAAPGPAPRPAGDAGVAWREAVAAVEQRSFPLAAALKQAQLVSLGDAVVSLRIGPGLHARTLADKRADVEAIFARHLGRSVRLDLVVSADAAPAATEAPPAQSLAATERAERDARAAQLRQAARNHPHIQEAAKILGGDIEGTEEL
jgi:DNA polymerase-3 subunit gamma/tau